MELVWWLVAIVVMAIGLLGTVLPVVPGTTIILAAAIVHRIALGPEKSLAWWHIAALVLLTLISYAVEYASGYFGAKRFGATKWGVFGAIVGGIAGMFFPFPGLLVGPVVGAFAGELVAGQRMVKAGRAGWGTLLGNLAGMLLKLILGLVMVSWFLLSVPTPFKW